MTAVLEAPAREGIGLLRASALYIAAVLGTGILVLPALASRAAGPASLLAVVALFLLSIPLAGTFAALAARHPDAGGVTTAVRRALGTTAARMTGYWFFFGVTAGAPVVSVLAAEHVVVVLGGDRWQVPVIAALVYLPPLLANVWGVRVSGAVQLGLTSVLVAVVAGVVTLTAPGVRDENFTPFLPEGWTGVGTAISLFVWAFAGWEAVTHLAGEFRRPRRTIPLATAVAVVAVGAAYFALQWVTVGVLGPAAGESSTPLVELVAGVLPAVGPIAVAAIAVIVAVGVLNTYLAAFANLGASLGRDGDLPRWIARGAEAGGVPRRALAVTGLLSLVYFAAIAVTGLELSVFILIHTSCMVAVYALGMLAAVRLLERGSLGWWLAVVSLVLVTGLLLLAGFALLVPALLAVAALAWRRPAGDKAVAGR